MLFKNKLLDFIECKASEGSGGSGGTGNSNSNGSTNTGNSNSNGSNSKGWGGNGSFSDALNDNFGGAMGLGGPKGYGDSLGGFGDGTGGLGGIGDGRGFGGGYGNNYGGYGNNYGGYGNNYGGYGNNYGGYGNNYGGYGNGPTNDSGNGIGGQASSTSQSPTSETEDKDLSELASIAKAAVDAVNEANIKAGLEDKIASFDINNPERSLKSAMDNVKGKVSVDHPDNPALSVNVTNERVSVTNKVDGYDLGGWKNDPKSPTGVSGYGIGKQMSLGNPGRLGIGKTFTSYEVENNVINYSKPVGTFTTKATPNDPNYGYKTHHTYKGFLGTKVKRTGYLNREIGGVNKVDISYDTIVGKIKVDYHYWNTKTGAVGFGYMAEMAMDVLEALNVDVKIAGQISKAVEIASILAFSVIPGFRLGITGLNVMGFNNAIGASMALSGFTSAYSGLMNMTNILGTNYANTSFEASSINDRFSFDKDSDLGGINPEISNNFLESPIGSETYFLRSNDLLPVKQETPTQKIKRNYVNIEQGELGMEATLPTELVGMNNSRASNLLSINEAQYLENVYLDRGIVESCNNDALVLDNIDEDYIYMYDDDGFQGGVKYSKSQKVSIAQLANMHYCIVDGKVHMLETKKNGYDNISDRLITLRLDPGNISLEIATNLSEEKLKEIEKMTSEMRVVAEAEKSYIETPKNDDLPKYVKVDASIDSEDYKTKFKDNLKKGIRKALVKGTTKAADGKRLAIVLGGLTETAVAKDGKWQVELDLLVAFGSVFNRFSNDELSYAVTVYDEKTGRESIPIKNDMSLTYDTKVGIKVKNIPEGYKAKLYRRNVGSTLYKYITTLDKEDYEDNLTDIPSAQYLDFREIHDLEGLEGLVEHKATLFAFKGANVYFTRPGKPNTWNELQSVTINENVTGLASTPLGLMIFSKSTSYLLGGTDKFSYTLANISQSIGCSSGQSIQNIKNAVIWEFNKYLMVSIGSAINNLTRTRFELPKGKIINSVVAGDVYYLFMDTKVIKLDFNMNQPQITLLDLNSSTGTSLTHELHYIKENKLFKAYGNTESSKIMTYITNKFTGNSFDITKEWNSVNIVYSGNLTISVYIDDKEIVTQDFSSETTNVANIGIPVDHNEGLGIYLKIVGVGKVYNYRYIFDNRNMR